MNKKAIQVIKKTRHYSLNPETGGQAFTDAQIKKQGLVKGKDFVDLECVVHAPSWAWAESEAEKAFIDKLLAEQCLQHGGTQKHAGRVAKAKKDHGSAWLEKLDNGPVVIEITKPRGESKERQAQRAEAESIYAKLVSHKAVYDQLCGDAKLAGCEIAPYDDIDEDGVLAVKDAYRAWVAEPLVTEEESAE